MTRLAAQLDIEPLWVGDCHTPEWDAIVSTPFWHDCLTWLEGQGFSARFVTRVEVYLLDAPFARIWHYVLNDVGDYTIGEDGDSTIECRTVLLKELPPDWPPAGTLGSA